MLMDILYTLNYSKDEDDTHWKNIFKMAHEKCMIHYLGPNVLGP